MRADFLTQSAITAFNLTAQNNSRNMLYIEPRFLGYPPRSPVTITTTPIHFHQQTKYVIKIYRHFRLQIVLRPKCPVRVLEHTAWHTVVRIKTRAVRKVSSLYQDKGAVGKTDGTKSKKVSSLYTNGFCSKVLTICLMPLHVLCKQTLNIGRTKKT
jgi:hypothetical protein